MGRYWRSVTGCAAEAVSAVKFSRIEELLAMKEAAHGCRRIDKSWKIGVADYYCYSPAGLIFLVKLLKGYRIKPMNPSENSMANLGM